MNRLLLPTLVLAGCARQQLYFCPTSEYHSIYSEAEIDCDNFTYTAKVSREIHVAAGIMTDKELTDARGHTDVHVMVQSTFTDGPLDKETFTGLTQWDFTDNTITLGAGINIASLPHEEIHDYQIDHWVVSSGWHGDWGKLGYYGVADVAEWWLGIPRLCSQERILTDSQRQGLLAAGWNLGKYDSDPCQ